MNIKKLFEFLWIYVYNRGKGFITVIEGYWGEYMNFVEAENLKTGMRLARPIYNKKGVLLFERDSRLTRQAIESVKNFGLLGVYVLEPAEPLPPMSEEEIESERFQVMMVSSIQDELEKIIETKKAYRLQTLVSTIIKNYGHLEEKVHFYQNLRSKDDFVCRHALNTAILCAMLAHFMNINAEERQQTITAALLHDIGKMQVPPEFLFGRNTIQDNTDMIYQMQQQGFELVENVEGAQVRRICMQVVRAQHDFSGSGKPDENMKLSLPARILLVANRYDELTAMDLQGNTKSEVKALQEFLDYPALYDQKVVNALVNCIKILFEGVSVELNTGETGLVLAENPADILRPTLLIFKDNSILDLSLRANSDLYIVDIMKTLDNRYVMDMETVRNMGCFGGASKDAGMEDVPAVT